jgi:hypothetical protein
MSITTNVYPYFLKYGLINSDVFNATGDKAFAACKIKLIRTSNPSLFPFNAEDAAMNGGQLIYVGADSSVPINASEKNALFYVEPQGGYLKFSLGEIFWNDLENGLIFNKAIVWYQFSEATKFLVMHFDFGEDITVDGPFKLKMSTNGEVKINFNPS